MSGRLLIATTNTPSPTYNVPDTPLPCPTFEIGRKTEFANRQVRLNATLFDYDIEDFQVLEFTSGRFRTFNVPKAESSGGRDRKSMLVPLLIGA